MIIISIKLFFIVNRFCWQKIRKNGRKKTKNDGSRCMYFVSRRWRPGCSRCSVSSSGTSTALPNGSFQAVSSGPTGLPLAAYCQANEKEGKKKKVNTSSKYGMKNGQRLMVVVYLCNKNNTTVEKGSLNHYSAPKDVIVNLCLLSGNAYYIYHPITECLRFCRCYRSTTTGKERY